MQYYDPSVDEQVVLGKGEDKQIALVLISAHAWPGVSPTLDDDHYPTLPQLYNALAQRFLDTDNDEFQRYLGLQLGYLYEATPELATSSFTDSLPIDIRQFHVDWRLGILCMDTPQTRQHERDIRDRARRGEWIIMPEGSADLGGEKIDRELLAKLRAKVWGTEEIIAAEYTSDIE